MHTIRLVQNRLKIDNESPASTRYVNNFTKADRLIAKLTIVAYDRHVSNLANRVKRIVIGRPMKSHELGETYLPVRLALPIYASDALSSVAYAPDEILLTLALAGVAASTVSVWVGVAVVAVMAVVVLSYRQLVRAYPSGGGNYEVATRNLGRRAGLTVASSLLVDYMLTVAVSISQGAHYLSTAWPAARGHEVTIAVGIVVFLALINLRGLRESGRAFAIPTYLYMGVIGLMAVVGMIKDMTNTLPDAATSVYEVAPVAGYDSGLMGIAGAFLVLRAFSSGCAALTGVEAVANSVPVLRPPKSRNAARTLTLLGLISAAMMVSILYLARQTGVIFVSDPQTQLRLNGQPVSDDVHMAPVIGQIAETVFHNQHWLFLLVTFVTGLILILAANTAFNGFPQLASVLSRDSFLPHQLYKRGDRLTYSNGIIILAVAASALIVITGAEVTRLIQMYIVGVFISFSVSQLGMIRHWNRALRTETKPATRSQMKRSRIINAIGFVITGCVLVVVIVTKFTHGAWAALLMMAIVYVLMRLISYHYRTSADNIKVDNWEESKILPSHSHSLVLVSGLHRPAMRAISYAAATNPSSLEIVHVDIDDGTTSQLVDDWEESGTSFPLTIVASPYRDITVPVVQHIRLLRRRNPRDLIILYIPYFLVEHWWQEVLHNHSAARLRRELQYIPGVVVTLVPWRIAGVMEPEPVDGKKLVPPEQLPLHHDSSTTEKEPSSSRWRLPTPSFHIPARLRQRRGRSHDTDDTKDTSAT